MNTAAGKNGNRTGFTDLHGTVVDAQVSYCYDWADRLTSTVVTSAPTSAGPVAGGNLTTTGPVATLAYDSHGNTITLGNQTMVYDSSDRHTSTTVVDAAGTSTVAYVRDATGRIISRTATAPGGTATTIGSAEGFGDSLTLSSPDREVCRGLVTPQGGV